MAAIELDYMEYASDANAQTAYATSATATSQYPSSHNDTYVKATTKYDTNYWPYYATDPEKSVTGDSSANAWVSANGAATNQRFHVDLGSAKIIDKIYYENYHTSGLSEDSGVKNFTFWGSNTAASFAELTYGTDTGWTQLTTSQSTFDQHADPDAADPKYITVTNTTAYRYYAFKFADNWLGGGIVMGVRRIQLQNFSLKAYSESTVKTQGSYSLKGIATADAINKTLTRTIGSPIDLSGKDDLRFDIYSSRTGSNIKIGIHDSGGTTTETTPNVASANTWQTVVWDISAVADADKNAIDSIIITIVNADSANTFYIDNFFTAEDVSVTAEPFIITTSLSSLGGIVVDGLGFVYEESTSGAEMDVSLRTNTVVMKDILHRKNLKYIYHRINTHGKDVTMTVYIDGTAQIPTFTINTTTLTTRRIEDIPDTWEGKRFDIELSCVDVTDTDLEIYAPLVMRFTSVGG